MRNSNTFDMISDLSWTNGFCLAGITDISPPESFSKFANWINSGAHGTMTYLQNQPGFAIRQAPENIVAGARSILFLAARYPKSEFPSENSPLNGIISSYAWGEDYHQVLRRRAQNLVDELTSYSRKSIQTRITIDSAPVLEKPLAQRAGLGWQGRNTCLISPNCGSFFFIIGIFLDVELEPSPVFDADYCGKCRKCVDACPTGCIQPDRTIDARRCISYLSIEHKGSIPRDLRPLMGNWIFGCDICQNVCPWNQRVDNIDVMPEFLPENNSSSTPDLFKLLAVQPAEFSKTYRLSPIKRCKRVGLLRNAAVALGNSQSPAAVPVLENILKTEIEPVIRSHSAWALGRINTTKARQVLSDSLNHELEESVASEIRQALAN
jgi:epoxyqueuosine reductase